MACCPPGRCRCDPARLLPRICDLSDRVEQQRLELLELRDRLQRGSASPELAALAAEGGTLQQRTTESAAQLQKLRNDNAALEWSIENGNAEVRQLQQERRQLLQRLGDLEDSEKKLKQIAEEAEEQLASERHLAEERCLGHEAALSAVAARSGAAEQRCRAAELRLRQLRDAAADAESAAFAVAQASHHEADATRRKVKELQGRLQKQREQEKRFRREQEKKDNEVREMKEEELREVEAEMHRETSELHAELQHCDQLRRAESTLAHRLTESRRSGDHMEQQAMKVARELVDSSSAIAWLQAEVAAHRDGRAELEEMQQRNLQMRQQLETPQPVAQGKDSGDEDPTEVSEDRHKATVVSEALQVAWEGEAREHRQSQQQLQNLQTSCLGPARQELLRLAEMLLHDARITSQGPGGPGGPGGPRSSSVAPLEDLVRRLREKLSMDAVQQLMTSVESFALEAVEVLSSRRPQQRVEKPQRLSRSIPGTISRKPWDDASPSPNRPQRFQEPVVAPRFQEPVATPKVRAPGSTGPLYRLDAVPGFRSMESPARGRQWRDRRFDRLALDLEERFDEYSVHRPRRKAT